MQQTETYKFNLIETSDTFSPDALNENARTLEAQLARVDADLGTGGTNCRIETGTYTGTGVAGSSAKATVLQFERLPELLFVYGGDCFALFVKNNTRGYVFGYDRTITYNLYVEWKVGGEVRWSFNGEHPILQLNELSKTYTYTALFA